ncbi:hypothetical protein A2962_05425 [Candidatus Woesebacteria bacterium RIFCSPLOWO2_01_FULL_39_61]|uniref:Uncharacterized protein n=1 Tax=Candidatus Woesebacteria bacterium RIFCSPHIGHO2_02_FULL_39_13 TaxID=1802505 RepID=A0A1F7Z6V6_9BACT|nr:MAG: hypothetical protein A2692_00740 [Candidatus Woesebacteria bacterium RIFCSPHIGHO2_01_FULL_39_95]OGM34648.1 MAG: hypothetical protein A3D01_06430 [Candidatus Woesebacteria bacterium RIFCSPHIGHO2_02_FULL_39_13]OGM37390.1 MAG: hypothetical protein A3E13_05460 [Candidatus Woesebacteria bacterium RIFCSPHIGHO2_12_FULL_40_20]OGM68356.1 MAG: hypothetical protein A2962_05425 [Candidatus Woesebacteria bacterium RIFCSPLOWO2_01_FULL_39_61]OGM71888.1 MAG: hypothetical protein A3H19_05425 [Candidatus
MTEGKSISPEQIELVKHRLEAFRSVIWPIALAMPQTRKGTCANLSKTEADIVYKLVMCRVVSETLNIVSIPRLWEQLKILGVEEVNHEELELSSYRRGKLKKKVQFLAVMIMGDSPVWDELIVPLVDSGFRVVGHGDRPRISWSPSTDSS